MQRPSYKFLDLQSAHVVDARSVTMEQIQGRKFLRTGVKPATGQRVELWCTTGQGVLFRLSGQVVSVAPEPELPRPMY